MSTDVFLSIGRIGSEKQEIFVSAMEDFVRSKGLNPRAIGRTDFSSRQPLLFIEEVMQECSGSIIIAFERLYIEKAQEFRSSEFSISVENAKLPSVWNQIEAGMAYVLKHPLLVIKEKGLKSEGILEFGYDWYVQNIELDPEIFKQKQFIGIFEDWKKRVINNKQP